MLALAKNQLRGSIPPELGALTNLMGLWLHENQLSGSIPPELATLTNVKRQYRYLSLDKNQLDTNVTDAALLAWLDARDRRWRNQRVR